VARMGEKRNVYRLLVGKPEGKRPLGMLAVSKYILVSVFPSCFHFRKTNIL
jgi:hypothetical protein